jgi:hypothetical protein
VSELQKAKAALYVAQVGMDAELVAKLQVTPPALLPRSTGSPG